MKLFFDTETTGNADFNHPPNHTGQPRLVQLAAILTLENCAEVAGVNLVVKPELFTIPNEAAEIHGITTEFAEATGVSAKAAVGIFVHMARVANSIHAFNLEYDRLVILGEVLRIPGMPNPFGRVEEECEMLAMKDICKLPGRHGDFKWPKLNEAFKHATGREPEESHDALADVRSMITVHRWRQTRQVQPNLV